jgi:uncharacterized protein (DUF2141 family)
MRKFLVLGGLLLLAHAAHAASVQVTVAGVRNNRGHVLVALCSRADFLRPHCPWKAAVPAAPGDVTAIIENVPPGTYAAQAFHDENDDGHLNRTLLGLPREGMGFSNDAPMHFGPPGFEAASFAVGKSDQRISFKLRYW